MAHATHHPNGLHGGGNTSFTMAYEILDDLDVVVATGISVQVMYDYRNSRKVPVPEGIRQSIEAIQRT